ncbi:hypothetical protein DFJ74DRAFT_393392 [Hyaloraphidium curvatum]|nr:hypothetical protein DFJ74DRAFT_393392 [Hyaloraphidium curvatum]
MAMPCRRDRGILACHCVTPAASPSPSPVPAMPPLQRHLVLALCAAALFLSGARGPPVGGPRAAVFAVLGAHRSGTSGLAHAVSACLGLPLTRAANRSEAVFDFRVREDEPEGWFEHRRVVAAQERLLVALRREWHLEDRGTAPLPRGWEGLPEAIEARGELEAAMEEELGLATPGAIPPGKPAAWLVKDPRTALLLPLWQAAVANLEGKHGVPIALVPLLVIRDPDSVARSLHARDNRSLEFGRRMFAHHVRSAVVETKGRVGALVDYDMLLSELGGTGGPDSPSLRQLAGILDPDAAPHRIATLRTCMARILRPEHRHHSADSAPPTAHDAVAALYRSLRLLAAHPTPPRPSVLLLPALTYPAPSALPPQQGWHPAVTIVLRTTPSRIPVFADRALRSVLHQTFSDWFLVAVVTPDPFPPGSDPPAPADLRAGVDAMSLAIARYHASFAGRHLVLPYPDRATAMEGSANAAVRSSPAFLSRGRDGRRHFVHVHDVHEHTEGASIVAERTEPFFALERAALAEVMVWNRFPPISFVFSLSAWEAVGGFDGSLPVLGDWEFNVRFLSRYRISVLPLALANLHRRSHPGEPHPNTPSEAHDKWRRVIRDRWLRAAEGNSGGLETAKALAALAPDGPGEVGVPARRVPTRLDRFPDFLVVGAQKAGTTWLAENLRADPRFWVPPVKELHYFDGAHDPAAKEKLEAWRRGHFRAAAGSLASGAPDWAMEWAAAYAFPPNGTRDDQWYSSLFDPAPRGALAGEATPAYSVLPPEGIAHAARAMRLSNGGTGGKVVLMLREPASRAASSLLHEASRVLGLSPAETREVLPPDDPAAWMRIVRGEATEGRAGELARAWKGIEARSRYRAIVENWHAVFPYPSRMHVAFFDDVEGKPGEVLHGVVRFLVSGEGGAEVDRGPEELLGRRINAGNNATAVPGEVERELRRMFRPDVEFLVGFLVKAGREDAAAWPRRWLVM